MLCSIDAKAMRQIILTVGFIGKSGYQKKAGDKTLYQ